jgi:Phytanoyl-CoA dioxygenase (PhyH)
VISQITSRLRSHAGNGRPGITARLSTLMDYWSFQSWLRNARFDAELSTRASNMLAVVEREGICVVHGFWSPEQCTKAVAEVDRVIAEYPEYVYPYAKSDQRVYGANNASRIVADFNKDAELAAIASTYNHEETIASFTLAARMPATVGNQGSGEGWHRDAFLRQFKAILYLSDVGLDNGPFQIIRDSHRRRYVLHDMKTAGLAYMQSRLNDGHVAKILNDDPGRLITYAAPAGTLILVDTSTLHRGMPIKVGERYALTNYYYPVKHIDQAMYEKFKVFPPGPIC